MTRHPAITFEEWKRHIPPELFDAYQDAYGAVIFGAEWTGVDANSLSKDEALDYAAVFLKKLADWVNGREA